MGHMGHMGHTGAIGRVRNRVRMRRNPIEWVYSLLCLLSPVLSFTGSTHCPSICQSETVDLRALFQTIHLWKLSRFQIPASSIHSYPSICLHSLPVSIPNSASPLKPSTDSLRPYNPTTPLINTPLCRLIALFPPIPSYHPAP